MAKGKRGKKARQGIDRNAFYDSTKAVKLVKTGATAKFDETVEVAINLGVDPRQSDQNVRGVVQLPHGTGKSAARRRLRQGRQGQGGQGRGRGYRRRRGSGREGAGRPDRFRPLHRHART